MNSNEYQKLAIRTCSIPYDRDLLAEQFPNIQQRGMILHAVAEINSEAGEIADLIQKIYQGHGFDRLHMKKEIGDVLWGIAELCTAFDFPLEEVMECNIEKLKVRYPEGFSEERSLNRREGDV